jgi:hypothetical protein
MIGDQRMDEEVQRKVDAYRANPQQLMQRYQQNQELIDLLALQKLKSEKDAAARDMQLKMQQQPSTIKQQREQEMFQRTKDDMVKQTQGILGKRQSDQAKNLQQLARTPRPQGGIAGLMGMPGVPKGAMPKRLAGGGIVSFEPGGSVSSSPFGRGIGTIADFITSPVDDPNNPQNQLSAAVRSAYGPYANAEGLFKTQSSTRRAQAQQILKKLDSGELTARQLKALVDDFPKFEATAGERAPFNFSALGANIDVPDSTNPVNKIGDFDFSNQLALAAERGKETMSPTTIGEQGSGIASLSPQLEPPKAPAPAVVEADAPREKPTITQNTLDRTLDEFKRGQIEDPMGVGDIDMQSSFRDTASLVDDITGRSEKADAIERMIGEMKALEERDYNPQQEKFNRITAALIGAAGTSSLGYTGAGIAAGAMNERMRQKKDRRLRLNERNAIELSGMQIDSDLGKASVDVAAKVYAERMANLRTSQNIAANRDLAVLRADLDAKKFAYEQQSDAEKNELDRARIAVMKRANEIDQEKARLLDIRENKRLDAAEAKALSEKEDKLDKEARTLAGKVMESYDAAYLAELKVLTDLKQGEIDALREQLLTTTDDNKPAIETRIVQLQKDLVGSAIREAARQQVDLTFEASGMLDVYETAIKLLGSSLSGSGVSGQQGIAGGSTPYATGVRQ